MIFYPALCFVLTLSSTFANQVRVEQIMDDISSAVAGDVAQVAKAARGLANTVELNNKLLGKLRDDLKLREAQIRELDSARRGSADSTANQLASKINHNKVLREALVTDGKLAVPRFFGAFVHGVKQIVDDAFKMAQTRV